MANENGFYIPERAVAIFAHADDIEFGVAGTIARWTDAGTQVTYVIVTDNSAGSNKPETDLVELIEIRRQEALASAAVVGVNDLRFLGYKDGTLQPTMELRRDLTRIIREIRPQAVMTFDPTTIIAGDFYVNHPDHRATGEAAVYAVFPSAGTRPIFPELLLEGYEPHDVERLYLTLTMHGNHFVDITASVERKIEALRCHKSQIGDSDFEWVRKWSAEAGERSGQGYAFAEDFRLINFARPDPTQVIEDQAVAEEEA